MSELYVVLSELYVVGVLEQVNVAHRDEDGQPKANCVVRRARRACAQSGAERVYEVMRHTAGQGACSPGSHNYHPPRAPRAATNPSHRSMD